MRDRGARYRGPAREGSPMTRRYITEARTMATDRRNAAIHEAGHYVVTRWAGVRAVGAWIGRSDATDIQWKTSWIGQCMSDRAACNRLSVRRWMMIGVAGAFAEQVWENHFDPDGDESAPSYYLN